MRSYVTLVDLVEARDADGAGSHWQARMRTTAA
jgi:hypothetical protein